MIAAAVALLADACSDPNSPCEPGAADAILVVGCAIALVVLAVLALRGKIKEWRAQRRKWRAEDDGPHLPE